VRHHAKAVSAGSNQGTGIRRARFGRSFATRGASSGSDGSGAPSYAHLSALAPRALSRPLALAGLLLALAFALALAASPARATYVQSASWNIQSGPGGVTDSTAGGANASFDIAADPTSGDVFTGFLSSWPTQAENGNTPRRINKWDPTGTPGTPALFGDTFSTASNYAGVAIDPTTHNVYALVDPVDRSTTVLADPKIAIYQPDGTLLTSFAVSTNEAVGIDVDAAGNVYVPDPENGVVNKYDSTGALLDTTSGSALNDPADVALDAAGNLYVANRSSSRINEKQKVDIEGNNEGTVRYTFDGAHTGADFTGDIHIGKGTGDVVVATGEADRSILAGGTGDLTKGGTTISNVANAASFTVGASINSGTDQTYIPFGATITALDAVNGTLTISKPARSSGVARPLVSGSKVLTNVTNVASFQVGMGFVRRVNFETFEFIPSEGIPFQQDPQDSYVTTITAIDTVNNTLTLSDGVLSAGTGGKINGEYVTNVVTTEGAFEAGQVLKSAAINFNVLTGVFSVSGGNLVIADGIAAPSVNNQLKTASPTITNVNVSSGQFTVSLELFGTGVASGVQLPTPSASWDLTAKTLRVQLPGTSLPFTQGGTGVALHADLSANADAADALASLPTLGAAKLFPTSGADTAEVRPVYVGGTGNVDIRDLEFQGTMGGRDVPTLGCAPGPAEPLSGGTGTCHVETEVEGSNTPGRVAKFDANLAFGSDFIPSSTNYTAEAIAVDQTTGDVYVAGGTSPFANPKGVLTGPDAPTFSVKRYDASGNELEQIALGDLTAGSFTTAPGESQALSPAFGLDYDSTSNVLYTVGRAVDLTYTTRDSVVKVFSVGHTLAVDATGTGNGSVSADHGAISACDTGGGGTCTDDYVEGDTVTLHPTPGAHTTFDGWSVEGDPSADCTDPGADCTVTLDADVTVHATFTLNQHTLSVVKDGGGTGTVTSTPSGVDCGATCSEFFDEGAEVTLHAQATGASTFVGWSGGGCSGTADCVVTVNADTTVHALFTQPQPLTVVKDGTGAGSVSSTPSGIDCGSTCGPVTFPEGDEVVLTATPDSQQTFDGWTGCDSVSTVTIPNDTCTMTMDGPATVHATFTQITHNISVTRNGSGSGSVSGGPISCPSTCSAPAPEGIPVVLTATPSNHSSFTSWSGCDSTAGNQCTVNVDAAENVTATFTLIKYTLTVTPAGSGAGSVDADTGIIASCSTGGGVCTDSNVVEGTTVTLTATPAAHSSLAWTGCDSTAANQCTVTLSADADVTATFSLDSHSLAVNKTGSGSGSVSCDGGACAASYVHGTSVTLTALAASGSTFTGWSGGGCSGTGACTVALNSDTAVSANFDTSPITIGEDPNARREAELAACVKQASKAYKKALRKAKAKHGKARARAIKAARKAKRKAIANCNSRFGG
jgi:hypothetical protein